MTALVQTFLQPPSTVTMLQTRPSSASDTWDSVPSGQQHPRISQPPRNIYNTSVGGMATGSYRGHTSISPVAPYAFTSTPVVNTVVNPLRQHPTAPHLRQENRTSSAPVIPYTQMASHGIPTNNGRYHSPQTTASSSSSSIDSSAVKAPYQERISKDDSSIPAPRSDHISPRPLSSIELSSSSLATSLSPVSLGKPAPDRYRRNHRRSETANVTSNSSQGGSALPSGSGMATIGHLYNNPIQQSSKSALSTYPTYKGSLSPLSQSSGGLEAGSVPRLLSRDDMNLHRQSSSEQAKRYRRRSISSLEAGEYTSQFSDLPGQPLAPTKTYASRLENPPLKEQKETWPSPGMQRPVSSHTPSASADSTNSSVTSPRPSSAKRESGGAPAALNTTAIQGTPVAKNEAKIVNIPARGSSDVNKRLATPSPLSKPITMSPDKSSSHDSLASKQQSKPYEPSPIPVAVPSSGIPESPAAQHLAALNKKDGKKEGKSSRLRRAFSFGSAAELRKASAENNLNNNLSVERAKLRKERFHDDQEAEEAAIVQKQEASGLGEGIYSGQGQFFTGSTDNLSISSTASSASIMIRKMGKGMKKSTRSLVGLFRPKSVVGVPAADSAVPEPSIAQVAMVTVEAEREKVNVNVNPHDQVGGGTAYPKLERNSMDAASIAVDRPSSAHDRISESSRSRQSIVGGEKERAEVLAAVKKGILKRNGTESGNSSPVARPIDSKSTGFNLPQLLNFNESPSSSTPSTPKDDHFLRPGHRKTDSVTIEGEDYFMSIAKYASGDSKSLPGTPRSIIPRNISFSPRIQFHDTWPSGEYDRRGEIATCNRLTPMLAQQIKEELNSFKMEMEVHELSKVNTHFF